MSRKWVHCPKCTSVGTSCDLCNGFAGWYTGPQFDAAKSVDVESFITPQASTGKRFDHDIVVTADNMSDQLAAELCESIDSSDANLNDWETDFIGSCLSKSFYSQKQKACIYKIAKRLQLL